MDQEYQEVPFGDRCIYAQWTDIFYAFPIYAWMTGGIALCAAVWSVTALAVSVWVPDKLLAIVIPRLGESSATYAKW